MGMFEMSPDQVAEWRQQCLDLVESRVNGEEVLAAAGFRQGGASANYVASKAQMGGLVYAGIKMLRKKKAGGLPDKVMLAVTPDKLYAFKLNVGRGYKLGDEVALWDAGGPEDRHRCKRRHDGADDRVPGRGREGDPGRHQRQGRPGQPGADRRAAGRCPGRRLTMAIHRPRGGHYWHYWLVIVGGSVS